MAILRKDRADVAIVAQWFRRPSGSKEHYGCQRAQQGGEGYSVFHSSRLVGSLQARRKTNT